LNNMYVWGFLVDVQFDDFINHAVIVLIQGMCSTEDYATFQDIMLTVINIYKLMIRKEKLYNSLIIYQFERHLCAQLAKYQHYDIEHFKRSYGETLIAMDLANVKGVS